MVETSNGWREVTIGQLGRVVTGKTPPTKNPELFGVDFPFITPTDIEEQARLVRTARFLSDEGCRKQKNSLLPAGTVCFTCIGATIGKICMTTRPSFTNQQINSVVVDTDNHDPKYVYYLLRQQAGRVKALASGAATPIVNKSTFSNLRVLVPSLPAQRKTAAVLSAYDELIENNTRRIKILEEMAQTIYQEWFVNFRFPGHEKVRMVDSELGQIPEGWEVRAFSGTAAFINGYAFKPRHWGDSGKPIVKIAELKNGVTDNTPRYDGEDIPAKYHIENGDLLFSWSADLEAYIWTGGEALLNQHLFNVIPHDDLSRYFLFYSLKDRMQGFRSRSQGTTMRHIKRSALDEVKVAVPPSDLRRIFDQYVGPILSEIENLHERNTNLRSTRDLLLPKLISSEVSVEDVSEKVLG